MIWHRSVHFLAVLSLALVGLGLASFPSYTEVRRTPLTVITQQGEVTYEVEVAATPQDRATGLMFRRGMEKDHGMLFVFPGAQRQAMWMKNTYIALDMLFIGADGVVVSIAENTVPHSLEIIESAGPAVYVLELNAGEARARGMAPGDRVKHALIKASGS